jgi:serine protease
MTRATLALLLLAALAPWPGDSFAQSAKVNYSVLDDGRPYQRFIVNYSAETDLNAQLNQVSTLTGRSLSHVRTLGTGGELIEAEKALSRSEMITLMEALAAYPAVSYVEPDALLQAFAPPNDPIFFQQWHFSSPTVGINVVPAWDTAIGTGIRVAVLDTGTTNHPDLNANLLPGYDFISEVARARDGNGRDPDPSDMGDWHSAGECGSNQGRDSTWHGTAVAGIIAAVTNNAEGLAGVAHDARIIPVRVLGRCGGATSDIVDAIVWASGGSVPGVPSIAAGAHVINLSLGQDNTSCGSNYQTAINGAISRGTAVVAAAGNANGSVARPANCTGVIAVAATNHTGGKASYSNFGPAVDLAAPGGDTTLPVTTRNNGFTTPGNYGYGSFSGTSAAAPHVAGTAALVLSRCARTPAQLETLLRNTAHAFPQTCSQCGTGIVDAGNAVLACPPAAPVPRPLGGLYHDPARTGHGIEFSPVTPDLNTWALTFYTYNSAGQAEWYQAVGNLTAGLFQPQPDASGNTVQRYTYQINRVPRQQPDPTFRGQMRLDFRGAQNMAVCAHLAGQAGQKAVMSFSLNNEGTRQWCMSETILRASRPAVDLTGLWYAGPQDSGWGMTLASIPGNGLFAALYYYDAGGNPRWGLGTVAPLSWGSTTTLFDRWGYCRTCAVPANFPVGRDTVIGAITYNLNPPGAPGSMISYNVTWPDKPGGSFNRNNSPLVILSRPAAEQ